MNTIRKNIQKIKNDVKERHYSLQKVEEGERNLSKTKRIKRLWKKIDKEKGELIKEKMLIFFELEKELGKDHSSGNKYNKQLA